MSFLKYEGDIATVEKDYSQANENFKNQLQEIKKNSKGQIKISWECGKVLVGWTNSDESFSIENFTYVSSRIKFKKKGKHTGLYSWEYPLFHLLGAPEDIQLISFQKHRNKLLSEYFQYPPLSVIKQLQACMMKAFIPADLITISHKYCRQHGKVRRWEDDLVQNLYKNKELIRQCISDNMENIIPLILKSQNTTSITEIRKYLGKGLWKRLVKNSPTRNKLIIDNTESTHGLFSPLLEKLDKLPSSLLKTLLSGKILVGYDEHSVKIIKDLKLLIKPHTHNNIINTVNDTKRMLVELDKPLSKRALDWDLSRWETLHEKCTKEIRKKYYSDVPFEWMENFQKDFVSKNGRFKAKLLDSCLDIAIEGDKMHHCVASYANNSEKGNYMVFHISGEEESTLGLICDPQPRINQHYTYCNKSVSEESREFAKEVITFYKKEFKTKIEERYNETTDD